MIVQEAVSKAEGGVARRMNELGLSLKDVQLLDWNPGTVQMVYEVEEESEAKLNQSERMKLYWANKRAAAGEAEK